MYRNIDFFFTLLFPLGFHAEVIHDEAVDVGIFFYLLRDGLAAAMARLAVDADNLGGFAGVGCLQCCGLLERVSRNHAVVVVAGGDEHSGIAGAIVLDVVQWRICV